MKRSVRWRGATRMTSSRPRLDLRAVRWRGWAGPLLAACLAVLAGTLTAGLASAAAAGFHSYDALIYTYDGAAHSVQAHTSAEAPVVSHEVSEGVLGAVANTVGPLPVLLPKSVAANTGPRFVAAADGTIIDTMAPALAQQIDDVVTSLRTTGTPPTGVYQGGYRGQPGVYANLGGDLPPQPIGYYTESGVWPGAPGTERIVIGQQPGEVWYSPDHYGTFRSWP